MLIERLGSEAQTTLDDLWTTKLIPFKLTVGKIDYLGFDEYILRFYDSRLRSVDVTWQTGDSFEARVRVAVLGAASRIEMPAMVGSAQEAA